MTRVNTSLALTISMILGSQVVYANPMGGQVMHGSASFAQPNAHTLNITNSHNAIIHWQQFNIDRGQVTNFLQPSASSSVLNRVITNNPSRLLGDLNSNGRVFLINQHGILVGEHARVNTAGFFASTLNLTDADFLNGRLKFDGGGHGGINNQGYLHAGADGHIVLIAPDIENGGVIQVEDGQIVLAAGESITLASLENPAIQFAVTAPEHSVTNIGSIVAERGAATLFAGTLRHSGEISAGGVVRNADGSISLVAKQDLTIEGNATVSAAAVKIQSEAGTTLVEGEVSAHQADGIGGDIDILGEQVGIIGDATIDASGISGGGNIRVGGGLKGQDPDVQNARATYIGADTEISADATLSGDGGSVIVYADEATRAYGALSASAGSEDGDGGFIETSGGYLELGEEAPEVTAANGHPGTWLIDPVDIDINDFGGVGDFPVGPVFTSGDGVTQLDSGILEQALANGGTVIVETGPGTGLGDITVNQSLSSGGNDVELILDADNKIVISDGVSISSGGGIFDLTLDAGNDIEFDTGFYGGITLGLQDGMLVTDSARDVVLGGEGTLWLQNGTHWQIDDTPLVVRDFAFAQVSIDNTSSLRNLGGIVVSNFSELSISGNGEFVNYGVAWAIDNSTLSIDNVSLDFRHHGALAANFSSNVMLDGDFTLKQGGSFGGNGTFFVGGGSGTVTVDGGSLYPGLLGESSDMDIIGNLEFNDGTLITTLYSDGEINDVGGVSVSGSVDVSGGTLLSVWDSFSSTQTNNVSDFGIHPVIDCASGCSGTGFQAEEHAIGVLDASSDFDAYGASIDLDVRSVAGNTAFVNWQGFPGAAWSDGQNWSSGSTPLPGQYVFIESNVEVPAAVVVTDAQSIAGLQSNGLVEIQGGDLTINGLAFIKQGFENGDFLEEGLLQIASTNSRLGGTDNLWVLPEAVLALTSTNSLDKQTYNLGVTLVDTDGGFNLGANFFNQGIVSDLLDVAGTENIIQGTGWFYNEGLLAPAQMVFVNDFFRNEPGALIEAFSGYDTALMLRGEDSYLSGNLMILPGALAAFDAGDFFYDSGFQYSGDVVTGGGIHRGQLQVNSGSIFEIDAVDEDVVFDGLMLYNSGTVSFTSGQEGEEPNDLVMNNGSTIFNQGTLDLQNASGEAEIQYTAGSPGTIQNDGYINVSPDEFLHAYVQMANGGEGSIEVYGDLELIFDAQNNGYIELFDVSALYVGGLFDLEGYGGAIVGDGRVHVYSGGQLQIGTGDPFWDSSVDLEIVGGSFDVLSGDWSFDNSVYFSGGEITSTGDLIFNSGVLLDGSEPMLLAANNTYIDSDFDFQGVALALQGTLIVRDGRIELNHSADAGFSGGLGSSLAVPGLGLFNSIEKNSPFDFTLSGINTTIGGGSGGVIALNSGRFIVEGNMAFDDQGAVVLDSNTELVSRNGGSINFSSAGNTITIGAGSGEDSGLVRIESGGQLILDESGGGIVDWSENVDLLIDGGSVQVESFMFDTFDIDWYDGSLVSSSGGLTFKTEVNLLGTGDEMYLAAASDIEFAGYGAQAGQLNFLSQGSDLIIDIPGGDILVYEEGLIRVDNQVPAGFVDVNSDRILILSNGGRLLFTSEQDFNLGINTDVTGGTLDFQSGGGDLLIGDGLDLLVGYGGMINLDHTAPAGFTGGADSQLTILQEGDLNQVSDQQFNLDVTTALVGSLAPANVHIDRGSFVISEQFDAGDYSRVSLGQAAEFVIDDGGVVQFDPLSYAFNGEDDGSIVVKAGGLLDLDGLDIKDFTSTGTLKVDGGTLNSIKDTMLPALFELGGGATIIGGGEGELFIDGGTSVNVFGDALIQGTGDGGMERVNDLDISLPSLIVTTNGGDITVAEDATLTLDNVGLGVLPFETEGPVSVINGGGNIRIEESSFLVAQNTTIDAGVQLAGGIIAADDMTLTGTFDWQSGYIFGFDDFDEASGYGGFITTGQVNLTSGVLNTDWLITETSEVFWDSPSSEQLVINDATITNQGTFNISSYTQVSGTRGLGGNVPRNVSGTSGAAFVNQGFLIIDADNPAFGNAEAVEFDVVLNNDGGIIGIASGTLRIVDADGNKQPLVLDNGGGLQGFGTFDGDVININGTVSPGRSDPAAGVFTTGTLTVSGDFTQQAGGTLLIKLDSQFDQLAHDKLIVGGTLQAGGAVEFSVVNGSSATQLALLLDQSFSPLSYASFKGAFDQVQIPPGLNFTFSATGVITITSDNPLLNDLSNQLTELFENEFDYEQVVQQMQLLNEEFAFLGAPEGDDDDEDRRRAPRLVCK